MALQGLPQRLIQDGAGSKKSMLQAMAAAKEANANLVSHLVANGLAEAREIAIAASQEFGVPLLDLEAIQPDLDIVKLVSDKLLAKHRVLPLVKRGKRLFVAVSDPTNLHALDEIKFQTGLSVEAVVVEEDKLQRIANKAIEQVDTQMPAMGDDDLDLENLEVTGGEDDLEKDAVGRDDVEDAPIVRFVNKVLLDAIKKGASDIHFEPYEKTYRIRLRLDGYLKEIASPPVQLATETLRTHQGHVAPGYRRAPHTPGRAHQDAHLQEPRDRLPCEHVPHAVRREDRRAYSRSVERDAWHRRAGL